MSAPSNHGPTRWNHIRPMTAAERFAATGLWRSLRALPKGQRDGNTWTFAVSMAGEAANGEMARITEAQAERLKRLASGWLP